MTTLYLFFAIFLVAGVGLSWLSHASIAGNFTTVSFVFGILLTLGYLWSVYVKK